MYNLKRSIFFVVVMLYSCNSDVGITNRRITPNEFKNKYSASIVQYKDDSLNILKQLNNFLHSKEESFYSKEYSDSTELTIDTIMYSIDSNKVAIFSIVKSPMSSRNKNIRDNEHDFWYDAFCYLGIRQQDSFKLKWLRKFYSINWFNFDEIKLAIRNDYFAEFATIKDTSGAYMYKYNLDDVRFWDSPVWNEYFPQSRD